MAVKIGDFVHMGNSVYGIVHNIVKFRYQGLPTVEKFAVRPVLNDYELYDEQELQEVEKSTLLQQQLIKR